MSQTLDAAPFESSVENASESKTPPILRFIGRLILAGVDIYILALLLYFVLRFIMNENFWPIALGTHFIHWGLLPSFPLFILAALLRQPKRATSLLILVGVFLYLFGALFIPGRANDAPQGANQLRVMTYNHANNDHHFDETLYLLETVQADIVGLQEIDPDTALLLEDELLDLYPHRLIYGLGVDGKAILSRYPILEHELIPLATERPTLFATIDFLGAEIRVIVAHPPTPLFNEGGVFYQENPDTRAEIEQLLTHIDPGQATILLGDFNTTDQTAAYRLIKAHGLRDTYREVGFGFGATFAVQDGRFSRFIVPLVRLDYIWVTNHFIAMNSWLGQESGSDHLPVISVLALPG